MRKFDVITLITVVFSVCIILFLVQSVSNPLWFSYLAKMGIFENSKAGVKRIVMSIFGLSMVTFLGLLMIFVRIFIRMLKNDKNT